MVYRSDMGVTVQWLEPSGKTQPLMLKPGDYAQPSLSADGSRLAMILKGDVLVHDWRRKTLERVTFDGDASMPTWTPDDRYIVFGAAGGMSWIRSDGASKPQPLTLSESTQLPYSFTPDGKRLAFMQLIRGSGQTWKIWTVPVEADASGLRAGKAEAFLGTSFDERGPAFSPMAGGWLTIRMNPGSSKYMYEQSQTTDRKGAYRAAGGGTRNGPARGVSCSCSSATQRTRS